MAFELPALPYAKDALEPHISANTLDFHHGKHHNAYVTNLNKMIAGTELEGKSLEDVILAVAGDSSKQGIFNNAAQVWNHTFYWHSMAPKGGGKPSGDLAARLTKTSAASTNSLKNSKPPVRVNSAAAGHGWCWTVAS